MRFLLPALLFISSLPVVASSLPTWVNAEAARLYAQAALIEWSSLSYPSLDRSQLSSTPLVLARVGARGERIVQVVYRANRGSYVVTMIVDSDGFLRVHGRSATVETPEAIAKKFYDPAFDPSSLLEIG